MSRRGKILEWLKTAGIVLLSISALFLLSQTQLFSPVLWQHTEEPGTQAESGEETGGPPQAARPLMMAMTDPGGARYAVGYDAAAVSELYERFSAALGEALGSSEEPEAVSEETWREALSANSLYFDFGSGLRLDVLSSWLGTEMQSEAAWATARRLCLVADENAALYYIDESDGAFYCCATALTGTSISSRMDETGCAASFAWELGADFDTVEPYFLILEELRQVEVLSIRNPFYAGLSAQELLTTFEINSFLAQNYPEADGTVVYVEGERTLRVGTDGTVTFSQTGGDGLAVAAPGETPTAAEVAEAAFSLARSTVGAWCGAAELYLTSLDYNWESRSYSLSFSYFVNGIEVSLPGSSGAAEVEVEGGQITSVRLTFREYTITESALTPLPALLEAAVVQASGGGDPILCYEEDGETAQVRWDVR